LEEVRKRGYVLTPRALRRRRGAGGRREPFEEKMKRLTAQLQNQLAEGAKLDDRIKKNLRGLGYAI
jgi:type I restriction enzyme M protein